MAKMLQRRTDGTLLRKTGEGGIAALDGECCCCACGECANDEGSKCSFCAESPTACTLQVTLAGVDVCDPSCMDCGGRYLQIISLSVDGEHCVKQDPDDPCKWTGRLLDAWTFRPQPFFSDCSDTFYSIIDQDALITVIRTATEYTITVETHPDEPGSSDILAFQGTITVETDSSCCTTKGVNEGLPITSISAGLGFFVDGDVVADFPNGTAFTVVGTALDDGAYTVSTATLDCLSLGNDETCIVPNESLFPGAALDGKIYTDGNNELVCDCSSVSGTPPFPGSAVADISETGVVTLGFCCEGGGAREQCDTCCCQQPDLTATQSEAGTHPVGTFEGVWTFETCCDLGEEVVHAAGDTCQWVWAGPGSQYLHIRYNIPDSTFEGRVTEDGGGSGIDYGESFGGCPSNGVSCQPPATLCAAGWEAIGLTCDGCMSGAFSLSANPGSGTLDFVFDVPA